MRFPTHTSPTLALMSAILVSDLLLPSCLSGDGVGIELEEDGATRREQRDLQALCCRPQ